MLEYSTKTEIKKQSKYLQPKIYIFSLPRHKKKKKNIYTLKNIKKEKKNDSRLHETPQEYSPWTVTVKEHLARFLYGSMAT